MQGGDLTSESILPCIADVERPDPSKGPRESCGWLGNDLVEDHVDEVGNDQLQYLIPVRLCLQHHQDRDQYPVYDLRVTNDGGEGAELVDEEACQV